MPIDASIPLQYKQDFDPLRVTSGAMGLANIALQQDQLKAAAQDQQIQRERRNRLQELLASGAEEEGLRKGGFLDESLKLGKERREMAKTDAETLAKNIESAKKRVEISGSAFGYVRQNPTLENANAALDYLQMNGVLPPQQVAQYKAMVAQNPANIAQLADQAFRSAMDVKDQIAKYETKNLGGRTVTQSIDPVTGAVREVSSLQNTQSPDSVAQVAATMRGQNMVDARSREQTQATREANATVYDPERGVLVNKATGAARPAMADGKPLGAKDKPMTDAQAKANLFGTRMKESDRIISNLEGLYSPAAVNAKMTAGDLPVLGGVAGMAGNAMLSDYGQQAEQAQRDFVNAVLRRESGAVISPSEFANAQKQYFPQPGDTKETLAQKARNRKLAISGLEVEVPGGFKGAPTLTNPQAGQSQLPKNIEDLVKKHGGR